MLGVLAKYIFGGMMGDAPETTAPEMQYHTREVNDWLLVDVPDQAIDDEDMDSESDDDEILTALPLLMREEVVVRPLQTVQSHEYAKDYSVCDKSNNKVHRRCADKICSVPLAVQHHSGDKTQGNFVDNVEAVSIEVEDNLPGIIQDISVNVQVNSDGMVQNEFNAQVSDASLQRNSSDVVYEVSSDVMQSEVQNSSVKEIESNSIAKIEAASDDEDFSGGIQDAVLEVQGNIYDEILHENSDDESHSEIQENSIDKIISNFVCKVEEEPVFVEENSGKFKVIKEVQNKTGDSVFHTDFEDEINYVYSDNQKNSDDLILNNFVHKVEETVSEDKSLADYNVRLEEFFCAELKKLYAKYACEEESSVQFNLSSGPEKTHLENSICQPINKSYEQRRLYSQVVQMGKENQNLVHENSSRIQTKLNPVREELYLENLNSNSMNTNCGQRRLYSQVVKMGGSNQNSNKSSALDTFGVQLEKNYDRYVRVFSDEINESSDDEMNEASDDEMSENPSDKVNRNFNDENSVAKVERASAGEIGRKSYGTEKPRSSDEESDENSDDENMQSDFRKRCYFVPNKGCYRKRERLSDEIKEYSVESKSVNMESLLQHAVEADAKFEHAVYFNVIDPCWYAYQQTSLALSLPTVVVRNDYLSTYPSEQRSLVIKSIIDAIHLKNKHERSLNKKFPRQPDANNPISLDDVRGTAEYLQNFINQKSTILPTKTGVVLEHIKALKPEQQAIQLENRKYLTRSQLNRQNRNYIYQSTVKTNRRKNLQRNHSGANNNRKC